MTEVEFISFARTVDFKRIRGHGRRALSILCGQ